MLEPNPGLIIWTIVTFVLLLIVLRKFAWRPLLTALHGGRMKTVIDMVAGLSKEIGKTHAIVGFVYGSIGILSMMRGPENFFMDLMEHPDEVLGAIEVIDEVLVDYAKAQAEAGAHTVCIDHLYCSQSILSKPLWEKFEGRSIKKIWDAIR